MNEIARRPRISILTNGNYFSNLGLAPLLHRRRQEWDFQVVVTHGLRRQKGSKLAEALQLFRRWGWRYSLYKIGVVLAPRLASLVGRVPFTVEQTCHRLDIPCHGVRNANQRAARGRIESFGPDILVSFSCPHKVKRRLLDTPRIGCINVHSSLLPSYAGVCTYVHVLADRQERTGVTVHEMVDQFDAGKILAQEELDVHRGMSVFSLFSKQCELAAPLIEDVLARTLENRRLGGRSQALEQRSYRGEPAAADIKRLKAAGHALFRREDIRPFMAAPRIAAMGQRPPRARLQSESTSA